ncbi:MAG: YSIRK-type signal peptide-containing protein, partial [Streptococcus mitis]|nr:YSIRK-type signal peptide-containing protein [Streptococcus mitis]
MENKSNSLNRIKRHQREKVLRFSIRKYSFGAASVAVAALMFLGARVASADTVSGSSSQSTEGVVQPNDKGDSPVGIKKPTENKSEVVNNALENKETALVENGSNTVDKSQLRTVVEELNSLLSTKLNLDDSVLSSVKERVQRAQALLDKADAVQKDINELKELLSTDLATLSNAVKESSEVRESNTGTETEKPASQPSSEVRASEENQTVSAKKDSLKVSV